jgi:hypothetical protein
MKKNRKSKNVNNMFLDITQKQYFELRQESTDYSKRQDTILNMTITLCAGVYTIAYYFMQKNALMFIFFLSLLAPSAISFLGAYWLSMVFQQKRYTMYLVELENIIKSKTYKFNWEQYINQKHALKSKKSFKVNSTLMQKINLAMYLLVPVFMYITAYLDKLSISFHDYWQYVSGNNVIIFSSILFIIVYIALIITCTNFLKKILNIQRYILEISSKPLKKNIRKNIVVNKKRGS